MKVSWQLEDKTRGFIAIFIDDEFWRRGHRSILGSKPALPKDCQEIGDLQTIYTSLEYAGAKKYAYQRLSIKGYSTFEMKKLLADKLVSPEASERVLAELQQLGYINDREWVAAFVRSQTGKRMGPQRIKARLRQKGIPADLIEQVIEKSADTEAQGEGIARLLATRYRSRNLSDYHERQKVIAALMRRGYDLDEILDALKGHS